MSLEKLEMLADVTSLKKDMAQTKVKRLMNELSDTTKELADLQKKVSVLSARTGLDDQQYLDKWLRLQDKKMAAIVSVQSKLKCSLETAIVQAGVAVGKAEIVETIRTRQIKKARLKKSSRM
jgi:hypothetical protein